MKEKTMVYRGLAAYRVIPATAARAAFGTRLQKIADSAIRGIA
jgi:hypothetical protein